MNDLSYLFDSNFKLFTLKYKEIFSENEARN